MTGPAPTFLYVECDVPAGQSLADWRRTAAPREPRRGPRAALRRLADRPATAWRPRRAGVA